jgi:hypothetical protein
MSDSDLVRTSRDGDQFHYLWAAQRCLGLLSPNSDLVAVSIEGASSKEEPPGQAIEEGEEVIDVGEYYGSQDLASTRFIRYMQLKHSTKHASEEWTISGLKKTLSGFAERCVALKNARPTSPLGNWLELHFVTNRPVSKDVVETIEDAAKRQAPRHPRVFGFLEEYSGLNGGELAEICSLLRLQPEQKGFLEQRQLLAQGLRRYLPGADSEAPLQLKDLVTRKATSEFSATPQITKFDVLKAIDTSEEDLFPARCLIEPPQRVVVREQEAELTQAVLDAVGQCLIVEADGGVGKSVLALRLPLHLPSGSHAVVYDCFGNGTYRSPSGFRHRHKDAFVQIANELAGATLCDPLIPSAGADNAAYTRAFLARLSQALQSLRARAPEAVLWIVVDAADNAEMAAQENSDGPSFARDLLREQIPAGTCVVLLCRPYRVHLLNPPPSIRQVGLRSFSKQETESNLRQAYPNASEQDVDEFHRLSSQNPRVQATAVAANATLPEVLRALGPNPTTVESLIESLLEQAVARVKDEAGASSAAQIDRICQALATLRPLIPMSVLSAIAAVPPTVVRSFVNDLQRPILLRGELLQFVDEPTESWFRSKFRPSGAELVTYLETLRPLASQSVYVASVLPQLMLEAGQIAELVALALGAKALPENNPIERRDLELQRLQFALKACLQDGRRSDAAKIALKAAGEAAADDRQQRVLGENTDLAATFIEPDRMLELVARRAFRGKWLGEHYAYEASFLSGRPELRADARSRLRIARDWLRHWSSLTDEERRRTQIDDAYIVELAFAQLNVHGPKACANELSGWTPRTVAFRVAYQLGLRLADLGRVADIAAIAADGIRNVGLVLALNSVLQTVGLRPSREVVTRAARVCSRRYIDIRNSSDWGTGGLEDAAAVALACAALHHGVMTKEQVAKVLRRHYPRELPRGSMSPYGGRRVHLLRIHAVLEQLEGTSIEVMDFADSELRNASERTHGGEGSRELREFKESVGALLPWSRLWASVQFNSLSATDVATACEVALAESQKAEGQAYRQESTTVDEIACSWAEALGNCRVTDAKPWVDLTSWAERLRHPLASPTLARVIWFAARCVAPADFALRQVAIQLERVVGERAYAGSTAGALVALSRAVLPVSASEANHCFKTAIEIANRLGDESLARWTSLLCLAEAAAVPEEPHDQLAYRMSRAAELTYDYVDRDKHFDWERTVGAVLSLCRNSGVAILSRWKDRRFGRWRRLLPIAAEHLLRSGHLDPWTGLALLGFQADWVHANHLSLSLERIPEAPAKAQAATFYLQKLRLEPQSLDLWKSIKIVAVAQGIDLSDIDSEIDRWTQREAMDTARRGVTGDLASPVSSADASDWDLIFGDRRLSDRADLELAYANYRESAKRASFSEFFAQATGRVQVGQEAEIITALLSVTELDLWDYSRALAAIPEAWLSRLSVKPALRSLVKRVVSIHCLELSPGTFYEIFPLEKASQLSGYSRAELCTFALEAIGATHAVLDTQNLFRVVNLLAGATSAAESREALGYGLELLEGAMRPTDGDGDWRPELRPPSTFEECIAGYIWAALGSPEASVRWEAAHVVRHLCRFGKEEVLRGLIERLGDGSPGPFADTSLFFYSLHARQWLLIALARAAQESPSAIAPHVSALLGIGLGEDPHVLMRRFAAECVTAVASARSGIVGDHDLERLNKVNRSPFEAVVSKYFERSTTKRLHDRSKPSDAEPRFLLGYDFKKHWPDNLARNFAVPAIEIESMIGDVIWDDWQFQENGHWDRDERGKRRHFERRGSYSYGEDERCSNLSNYLAYHAIMTVAGKLLETLPTHRDPDDTEDGFANWLSGHALTRFDGAWLADRRDAPPRLAAVDDMPCTEEEWPTSVRRDHFRKHLLLPDGQMIVAGRWTIRNGRRIEEVRVTSALVAPERATALVHALQCARTPFEHHLPNAGDEYEVNHGPFRLQGWITDPRTEKGLDQYDPWSGSIEYPPNSPAADFARRLELSSDAEQRLWSCGHSDETMECMVWGTWEDPNQDAVYEGRLDSGRVLAASPKLLHRLMSETSMQIVFDVRVDRGLARARYGGDSDDSPGYAFPYSGILLLTSDGSYYSVV